MGKLIKPRGAHNRSHRASNSTIRNPKSLPGPMQNYNKRPVKPISPHQSTEHSCAGVCDEWTSEFGGILDGYSCDPTCCTYMTCGYDYCEVCVATGLGTYPLQYGSWDPAYDGYCDKGRFCCTGGGTYGGALWPETGPDSEPYLRVDCVMGCTDPTAWNYDYWSEEDDGNCQYSGSAMGFCDDCLISNTVDDCCDSLWEEFEVPCWELERSYDMDCSGCNCPGDVPVCKCWCDGVTNLLGDWVPEQFTCLRCSNPSDPSDRNWPCDQDGVCFEPVGNCEQVCANHGCIDNWEPDGWWVESGSISECGGCGLWERCGGSCPMPDDPDRGCSSLYCWDGGTYPSSNYNDGGWMFVTAGNCAPWWAFESSQPECTNPSADE